MSYDGGRYKYKIYKDENGVRIAADCFREQNPDLQSSYLYNRVDGSEVLRYIMLDIDAKNTCSQFKDENGVVSWQKIACFLKIMFPHLLRQIEYVVRSHGKKGLHILIGITPLPLNAKSVAGQLLARKIQSNVIEILNFSGIGADPGAIGLRRDFATFRNNDNVLHHNRILTKKIENLAKLKPYVDENGVLITPTNRPRILNDLSSDCDKLLKKLHIKNGYRLYRDRRVEKPFARLFLFLMGMYKQDLKTFFAWKNVVELTLDELEEIMETSRRNFANYIETEEFNEIFHIEKVSGLFETGRYRISLKDSEHLDKRIQRALQVLSTTLSTINFRLIPPELVEAGFKNTAIVSWALSLKWQGVPEDLALLRIQALVKLIPGYEESRSCKNSSLKATVSSIYRNRREMQGSKASELLPDWLEVSNVKVLHLTTILSSATITLSRSIHSSAPRTTEPHVSFPISNLDPILQGLPRVQKLKSVSFKHRVGFFYNNELILVVVKNRHYVLSKILEHIETNILKTDIKFDVLKDVIHVRHNTKEYFNLAKHLYSDDDALYAIKAQHICGLKKSFAENLSDFKAKKSVSFEEHLKINDGFNLEYDGSMFQEFSEFPEFELLKEA